MNGKTPISEIKLKAKDELLGNYSIAVGSFVILFAFIYLVMSILSGGAARMAFAGRVGAEGINAEQMEALMSNGQTARLLNILLYIVMAIATPLIAIITTGYTYICREIAYGRPANINGLFIGFKNHPDKIIIISLIAYVVTVVTGLPANMYSEEVSTGDISGQQFLIYAILLCVGAVIRVIFTIAISQSYLAYLDNPEATAFMDIKISLRMMKGNMWRFFCLMLSFLGYYLLIIASIGIAALWVVPYQEVAMVDFYRDIKERCSFDYRV